MKRLLWFLFLVVTFSTRGNLQAQWVECNVPFFKISGGVGDSAVSCLAANGTNIIAGSSDGAYVSTDSGISWAAKLSSDTYVYALTMIDTNIFASVWSYSWQGVVLSTDNGASWKVDTSGLSIPSSGVNNYVSSFAVSPNGAGGTNVFAANAYLPSSGLYLSNSNYKGWKKAYPGFEDNSRILKLVPSGTDLLAVTYNDNEIKGGLYLFTNDGTSWNADSLGWPNDSGLEDIVISPNGAGGTNLFACGSGVYLSTDNGGSWTPVSSGLPANIGIAALAVVGTDIFAGTSSGVYLSTNNGTSWTAVSPELTGYSKLIVDLAVSGENLFAATFDGLWRRPLSEMITGVQERLDNLPARFALKQNYPNPFNPTTTIEYQVAGNPLLSGSGSGVSVQLKVYDVLGKRVVTLVNEEKRPGKYEVQFDGSKLPSGVYLYRMQAGGFTETKKLLLMK